MEYSHGYLALHMATLLLFLAVVLLLIMIHVMVRLVLVQIISGARRRKAHRVQRVIRCRCTSHSHGCLGHVIRKGGERARSSCRASGREVSVATSIDLTWL